MATGQPKQKNKNLGGSLGNQYYTNLENDGVQTSQNGYGPSEPYKTPPLIGNNYMTSLVPITSKTRTVDFHTAVTGIRSIPVSESSLQIAWNALPPCDEHNPLKYHYQLYDSDGSRVVSSDAIANNGVTINGLDCETSYVFHVAAVPSQTNIQQMYNSSWSENITATTQSAGKL